MMVGKGIIPNNSWRIHDVFVVLHLLQFAKANEWSLNEPWDFDLR